MKKTLPEKLRICFLSQRFSLSDFSANNSYIWWLSRGLAAQGHDVTLITSEPFQSAVVTKQDGIEIHNLSGALLSELSASYQEAFLDRFEELHMQKPFDLVHSVDLSGLSIAQNKKALNVVLAVDVSVIQLDQIFGILGMTEETVLSYIKTSVGIGLQFLKSFFGPEHKLLKLADGVFVASPQQQDILERYYYIPSAKTHIIPYGLDAQNFTPAQTREAILKTLNIPDDTKLLVTATSMVSSEETKSLLSAFERVVVKKPRSALVIVGDGPKRKELELHMLNLALASKVYFVGAISQAEVNTYINASDAYINLNSKSSGFEPTVVEAMACCKAVIASEIGTSSHIIETGIDGYLARPPEVAALSRLLLHIVSGQINTKLIGEKARQKILKMFDTGRMVEETITAYRKILK